MALPSAEEADRLAQRSATFADRREVAPDSGLCARCVHLQVLRTKTSTFVRCALSDADERFPRYPRLPVRSCAGFEEAGTPAG